MVKSRKMAEKSPYQIVEVEPNLEEGPVVEANEIQHFEISDESIPQPEEDEKLSKKGKVGTFLELIGFSTKSKKEAAEDNNAPQLPYWEIFGIFLWFGCRAFGGKLLTVFRNSLYLL